MAVNCHCKDCVTVMKYVDEHHPSGKSANVSGGVGKAMFYLKDIDFGDISDGHDGTSKKDPSDKFGYVKLGQDGKNVRCYTKCCGTMMMTASGTVFPANFRPFNRNCIFTADGTPFDDKAESIVGGEPYNMNVKSASDPNNVPEPKHDTVPFGILKSFITCAFKKSIGMGKNPDFEGTKLFFATGQENEIDVC